MEGNGNSLTMQLRGLGRSNGHCGGLYCTIWALVAMLVSFRALMALTILFLVLLVEGWGENANTQSKLIRYTHPNIHTDALVIHAFQGTGLMLVKAPRLLRANRVNESESHTKASRSSFLLPG